LQTRLLLAQQFGGLKAAAAALGFSSAQALQQAIRAFCGAVTALRAAKPICIASCGVPSACACIVPEHCP